MRDAGKCRRVKCGESAGSHPAIYTHEHILNECSSTHCVAQESSCREAVVVVVVIFFQYNESIDIVDELVLNRIL